MSNDENRIQQLDFRSRIYDKYVHSRQTSLAPANISGLRSREPYLNLLIGKHFPADHSATILDLGSGHGTLVHLATRAGYSNISGVDCSPEQVAEAARLGIGNVRLGDLMETLASLQPDSHDAIVTFDVIEHFTRAELLCLVDEVRRVLKSEGVWIIHAPNGESPFFGRILFGDATHEQAFTRISIGQLLLASGFREVNCFEDTPIVHGLRSALRLMVWKTCRGFMRLYLAAETGDTGSDAIFSQNFLTIAFK